MELARKHRQTDKVTFVSLCTVRLFIDLPYAFFINLLTSACILDFCLLLLVTLAHVFGLDSVEYGRKSTIVCFAQSVIIYVDGCDPYAATDSDAAILQRMLYDDEGIFH